MNIFYILFGLCNTYFYTRKIKFVVIAHKLIAIVLSSYAFYYDFQSIRRSIVDETHYSLQERIVLVTIHGLITSTAIVSWLTSAFINHKKAQKFLINLERISHLLYKDDRKNNEIHAIKIACLNLLTIVFLFLHFVYDFYFSNLKSIHKLWPCYMILVITFSIIRFCTEIYILKEEQKMIVCILKSLIFEHYDQKKLINTVDGFLKLIENMKISNDCANLPVS